MENKDMKAFEEVYNAYWDKAYYFAYRYYDDSVIAKEITQKVFIKVYKDINQFDTNLSFDLLIAQITVNLCYEYGVEGSDSVDIEDDILLEDVLNDGAKRTEFLNKFSKLPRQLKTVLLLYYYHELSIEDISKVLNIPVENVNTQLS